MFNIVISCFTKKAGLKLWRVCSQVRFVRFKHLTRRLNWDGHNRLYVFMGDLLVGGWTTHFKNMLVKMGSSFPSRGGNTKNIWNHHLVYYYRYNPQDFLEDENDVQSKGSYFSAFQVHLQEWDKLPSYRRKVDWLKFHRVFSHETLALEKSYQKHRKNPSVLMVSSTKMLVELMLMNSPLSGNSHKS